MERMSDEEFESMGWGDRREQAPRLLAEARRPKVGQVWYSPRNDGLLVVKELLPHFGTFLQHEYPGTVRCILQGNWPEGLVYVGEL